MSEETRTPGAPGNGGRRWDPFTIFLSVACLALAVLVLLLAQQNRRLKADLTNRFPGGLTDNALKEGDSVEPFELVGTDGEPTPLRFEGNVPRTLLLVFSERCPACRETLPIWNEIVGGGTSPAVRVVGIQTDRDETSGSSLVTQAFPFPVYGIERERPNPMDRIPYIPATVVLDDRGTVKRVWFGVLTSDQQEELRRQIGPDAIAGGRQGKRAG